MISKLRERGQLTIPIVVREALHIDQGDDVEFAIADGVVMMRGLHSLGQAWFWTSDWQAAEVAASADIASGNTESADDVESFLASIG